MGTRFDYADCISVFRVVVVSWCCLFFLYPGTCPGCLNIKTQAAVVDVAFDAVCTCTRLHSPGSSTYHRFRHKHCQLQQLTCKSCKFLGRNGRIQPDRVSNIARINSFGSIMTTCNMLPNTSKSCSMIFDDGWWCDGKESTRFILMILEAFWSGLCWQGSKWTYDIVTTSTSSGCRARSCGCSAGADGEEVWRLFGTRM